MLGFGSNFADLEFVSSGTLRDWMRNQDSYTSFTGGEVQRMLISCLDALEHFHRVICLAHFDVKSTKILLTEAKARRLCDFSYSRNPDSVTILQGTFEYMRAELFQGKVSNFSVVYSLAITFIQFICR